MKIDKIMLFCNLSIERPSYVYFCVFSATIHDTDLCYTLDSDNTTVRKTDQNYQPEEDVEFVSDQLLFDHLCGSDQQKVHNHHHPSVD